MALKDIRKALRAFVLADATVTTLASTRMFPGRLPQGETRDSIVYQEISAQGDHHNEGPSGLARPRFQITAWSLTADGAQALALAIKERLDGYRGVMGSGGNAVTVQGAFFDASRDIDDEVANLRGRQADYFVNFEEV